METINALCSIATRLLFLKGLLCIVSWFLCCIGKECFQFHIFSSLASRVRDYYLADNRDFHCLPFSSHSGSRDVDFPFFWELMGWFMLAWLLISLVFFVGRIWGWVFSGGGGVEWGGAGNPQSHSSSFLSQTFWAFFILLLFLILTILGIWMSPII